MSVLPHDPATQAALGTLAQIEPWKYVAETVGFQNSWADAGAGINRVRYRKSTNGIVLIAGQATLATRPGGSSTIFTLPRGYRQSNSQFFVCDAHFTPVELDTIQVGGAGVVAYFASTTASNPAHPSLDICFSLDAELS